MGWQDDAVVKRGWRDDAPVDRGSFMQRAGRYARGLIDEAANLGTGLSDEFGAAVDATLPTQFLYPTSQAETWKQRYDENLASERGRMKQFAAENPVAATAADVGGAIVGGTAALPAKFTAAGPSLIGNVAKMGGTGAALGAIQGFGSGEGEADRLAKAISGGVIGGAVGGLIPVAGAGVRKAMETGPGRYVAENIVSPLAQKVAGMFSGGVPPRSLSAAAPDGTHGVMGPFQRTADATRNVAETGAVERLSTAMQRSGLTPDDIARARARLGPEGMLADVDPQFMAEARRARTLPGQTRSHAETVLTSRDRQTGNRLTAAFEGSEPPPSAFALRGEGQAFDQNLRAVGQRAYGAMEEAGLKQTPELMEIYQNPHVSAAIDRVVATEQATRTGSGRAPASPVEIMHKVKQAIWDLGFDQNTARPGPMASWYRDLGIEYMNRLKRANPVLAEADRAYAQAASLPDYFDAGAHLLARDGASTAAIEKSAPALAELLARGDAQQVLAARSGATNAARSQAQESTRLARALAGRIDESAPVRDKLVQLYGREQADRIMQQAGAEVRFAKTSNDILSGSQSADKIAEVLDTNAAVKVTPQGATPRFFQYVRDIPDMLMSPNETVRDAIGRATLNPNSAETDRLLRLIAENLRRRQQGSPLAASIAGQSGSFVSP